MVPAEAVERFRADLERLTGGPPEKLGVAVSGGPDSLALLLLAAAAYPGGVEAATVDHRLRQENGGEAEQVGEICRDLDVQHETLALSWPNPPGSNIQARAREGRYHVLSGWALDRGIPFLATAHHVNDQAETVLMRLARGSGVSGLAGTREIKPLAFTTNSEATVHTVRPLLDWSRDELNEIVIAAGCQSVDDPTNADDRYDRTRIRRLLKQNEWLSPRRLSDSAAHLLESEEALQWAVTQLSADRFDYRGDGSVALNVSDLPRELQRRLLLRAFSDFTHCGPPPGPKFARLLDALREGRGGTLAGVRARGGEWWHLDWAPPRRDTSR